MSVVRLCGNPYVIVPKTTSTLERQPLRGDNCAMYSFLAQQLGSSWLLGRYDKKMFDKKMKTLRRVTAMASPMFLSTIFLSFLRLGNTFGADQRR